MMANCAKKKIKFSYSITEVNESKCEKERIQKQRFYESGMQI